LVKRFRFIEITTKQIKVYDAETTPKELVVEFVINFIYAFCANVMVPFIVLKSDLGVFITFLMYGYMLSYILNRDKYESKLGRYILMPIPYTLGAFTAIKMGYVIANLII
jgi:hypothetical protein